MIKVSIIVPMYHVEQYITLCLDSVAQQTMNNGIECIVVDDCGNDKSLDIAKKWIEDYRGNIEFRIVERTENGGLSAARNTGIEAARGEYLYFLDSDDEITPICLEKMWGMVEQFGHVDLVQGAFYEELSEANSTSAIRFPVYSEDRRKIKSFLLQYLGDIVGAQSRLVKKTFLQEHSLYFKNGIIHEDNYWTFFLAKYVVRMAYCNVCTYYHRYNPNSITGNVNVQKEANSFRCIIKTMCSNIDEFLPGVQKSLIVENLLTVLNNRYYRTAEEKEEMITDFLNACSCIEKLLFKCYLQVPNDFLRSKVLHLLLRIFKIND